jgi:hypothetical protein
MRLMAAALTILAVIFSTASMGATPKSEIRQMAREGKIRVGTCIRDSVVTSGGQPSILLENSCGFQVNIQLCERVSGDPISNHFLFLLQGKTDTRHPIWLKSGETFDYTYNACGAPYCTPPESDC